MLLLLLLLLSVMLYQLLYKEPSFAELLEKNYSSYYKRICLQCFDTVGWVAGRASGP